MKMWSCMCFKLRLPTLQYSVAIKWETPASEFYTTKFCQLLSFQWDKPILWYISIAQYLPNLLDTTLWELQKLCNEQLISNITQSVPLIFSMPMHFTIGTFHLLDKLCLLSSFLKALSLPFSGQRSSL